MKPACLEVVHLRRGRAQQGRLLYSMHSASPWAFVAIVCRRSRSAVAMRRDALLQRNSRCWEGGCERADRDCGNAPFPLGVCDSCVILLDEVVEPCGYRVRLRMIK